MTTINNSTDCLVLKKKTKMFKQHPHNTKPINSVFTFYPTILVTKLKLKGKTLKWRMLINKMYLAKFGVSHPTLAPTKLNIFSKIMLKVKLVSWGYSQKELRNFSHILLHLKKRNIYHGRGVRSSRQLLFRKAGKVSAYR